MIKYKRIALFVGHSILKNGTCTSADGRKRGGKLEYSTNKELASQIKYWADKAGQINTKLQSATSLEEQINQVKTQVDSKLQEATSKVNQIDTNLSSSTTSKQQMILYKL